MRRISKKLILKIPFLKKEFQEQEEAIQVLRNDFQKEREASQKLRSEIDTVNSYNSSLMEKKDKLKKIVFQLNLYRYEIILQKLKAKIKSGEKIRICFFVMYDSVFSAKPLYEKLQKEKKFETFIVVVPDFLRGEDHLKYSFNKTYSSLYKKYKNVFKGYDTKNKKAYDFSEKIDLVCFSTPYKGITNEFFEIDYFLDKDILPFYINYGFFTLKFGREIIKSDSYSYFWRVFVENKFNIEELKKYQNISGKNAIVTGYCKMDELNKIIENKKRKKTIIIAPHHTIGNWEALKISNFLKYADFFIELPKIYQNINFVFRPHPLLITQLKKSEIWGEKKTNEYIKKIKSYPNLIYSDGGDYLKLFKNSDGMIHDCGSFLAEYLFTGKPSCYILKNKQSIDKWFLPIGKKCLDNSYQAFSKKDILNFIDSVIIEEKDYMKNKRIEFVNDSLKVNYPHVSQVILNYIKKELNL